MTVDTPEANKSPDSFAFGAQPPEIVAAKNRWLDQLEKDRGVLVGLHPFIAAIALQLDIQPVLDDRLGTACTDGFKLFFNIEFLQQLPEDHRLGLIAHEVWHCVAGHFVRRGEQDNTELWNIACDHEVNNLLLEDDFCLPDNCVYFPQHRGKNAEQVYKILLESQNKRLAPLSKRLMDQHDFRLSEELPRIDPDYTPETSANRHKSRHQQILTRATEIMQQQPGLVSGGVKKWMQSMTESTLPWQEVLRHFVATDSTPERVDWQRPNRRHIGQGLFLPRRNGEHLNLLIAVDVSGSTHHLLQAFLSEVVAIMHSYISFDIQVLTFDTQVVCEKNYTPYNLNELKKLEFRSRGGTKFKPVFDRARQLNPNAMICFTDGYAEKVEQPPFPVLWALPKNNQPPVTWGLRLHIPDIG